MDDVERYRVLAAMLREARVRAGMSQMTLADLLGVRQTVVSRLEAGTRRLDLVEMIDFCGKMGLDPMDFFGEFLRRTA